MSTSVAESPRDRSRVQVYHPQGRIKNVLGKEIPLLAIEKSEARRWVEQGLAEWVNRAKGIRLKKLESGIPIRDESCVPGAHTILRFVDGSESAAAIVEAWQPKFHFMYEGAPLANPA